MKHKAAATFAGTMLALGLATIASAGDKPNVGEKKAESTATTEQLKNAALARQLASYGNSAEDPLVLIAAARVMKQNPVGESDKLSDDSAGDVEAKEGRLEMTPDAVLARAKELAGERQDLIALADDVDAMSSRGAVRNGGRLDTRVMPESVDVYEITYAGDRLAQVGIDGDDDTDLDLVVFDENGHTICESTSYSDFEICEWTPRWTGVFTVKVYNHGDVWNGYTILTN